MKLAKSSISSRDRHHRQGDERWSFDDAVERHRCTQCEAASSVHTVGAMHFHCAEVFSSLWAYMLLDGEVAEMLLPRGSVAFAPETELLDGTSSLSAPSVSVRGGVTSVQNIMKCWSRRGSMSGVHECTAPVAHLCPKQV